MCGPGRTQQTPTTAAKWLPEAAGRQGNREELEKEHRLTDGVNEVSDA